MSKRLVFFFEEEEFGSPPSLVVKAAHKTIWISINLNGSADVALHRHSIEDLMQSNKDSYPADLRFPFYHGE